ncbi:hypothetical protein C8J56DRAFT_900969 [Mycena floridula]|nr:hypothetical protein C8J56DRAFT_900969 [Mycena floridula]
MTSDQFIRIRSCDELCKEKLHSLFNITVSDNVRYISTFEDCLPDESWQHSRRRDPTFPIELAISDRSCASDVQDFANSGMNDNVRTIEFIRPFTGSEATWFDVWGSTDVAKIFPFGSNPEYRIVSCNLTLSNFGAVALVLGQIRVNGASKEQHRTHQHYDWLEHAQKVWKSTVAFHHVVGPSRRSDPPNANHNQTTPLLFLEKTARQIRPLTNVKNGFTHEFSQTEWSLAQSLLEASSVQNVDEWLKVRVKHGNVDHYLQEIFHGPRFHHPWTACTVRSGQNALLLPRVIQIVKVIIWPSQGFRRAKSLSLECRIMRRFARSSRKNLFPVAAIMIIRVALCLWNPSTAGNVYQHLGISGVCSGRAIMVAYRSHLH